ncbi:GtrA family protein [Quadrisphaera sp. DSM 44207]|uniref:GtrA family protein n=1 Tax=Quadrisphaera sp. DSM 44207 TaxID=1881057 RepID=UPI000B87235A|nr:GtrA family protein [Quadrisphaera sp. DSM 44207]
MTVGPVAPAGRLRFLWSVLARELAKFGVVGGVAFVVDVGLFNLLRWGGDGALVGEPLTAKVISAGVATLVAWGGNRWWTFRHRRGTALLRELGMFVAMNGVALLISVLCLAFSHYLLGLRSPLADNVSANVVGVALGTAFRFVAYRSWVFRSPPPGEDPAAVLVAQARALGTAPRASSAEARGTAGRPVPSASTRAAS